MDDRVATESLFEHDVLVVRDDRVTTSDSFEADVAALLDATPTPEAVATTVREIVGERSVVDPLVDLCLLDPRSFAELRALSDALDGGRDEELVGALPTLRLFRAEGEPDDGAPAGFLPVPATHVPALSRLFPRSLVYIWLDDCDPCETVRADLETLFADPQGVMPFAVYGPDYSEFLLEEYAVNSGPTVLFMRDGHVDVRLYGAQPSATLATELETLRR